MVSAQSIAGNITGAMTPEEVVIISHNLTAVPAMIILFIFMAMVFLIVGLSIANNRKRFMVIYIPSIILSLVGLVSLIFMPNFTQSIANLFSFSN